MGIALTMFEVCLFCHIEEVALTSAKQSSGTGDFLTCHRILLIAGSTDSKIHCWNTETGMKLAVLGGDHTGPVQCVQFNPKYMMLATACSNMVSK